MLILANSSDGFFLFQSLFFWKWGFKPSTSSAGTVFSWFQSLFFWKWGFKTVEQTDTNKNDKKFQSLFFWKWGFKVEEARQMAISELFQSLFFWKWGFKTPDFVNRIAVEVVSILVFLEVGF